MKRRGFTLIEILVVIAILGVLSAVVLASLNAARSRAGNAAARSDLKQILKAIQIAQAEQNKPLWQITGSGCSDCGTCRTAPDLRNVPTNHACYTTWVNNITAIQNATNGQYTSLTKITRDPWGSPYTIDENEGEVVGNPCANQDSLRSVGPDGAWGTADDIIVRPEWSGTPTGCH